MDIRWFLENILPLIAEDKREEIGRELYKALYVYKAPYGNQK